MSYRPKNYKDPYRRNAENRAKQGLCLAVLTAIIYAILHYFGIDLGAW